MSLSIFQTTNTQSCCLLPKAKKPTSRLDSATLIHIKGNAGNIFCQFGSLCFAQRLHTEFLKR